MIPSLFICVVSYSYCFEHATRLVIFFFSLVILADPIVFSLLFLCCAS